MKRTQIKDILRNIWKGKVSYLSIIVIATLGVMAFLSIDYTTASMKKSGSDIYNRLNYRDIEIVSTLLFSADDEGSIRNIDGVADVETVLSAEVKTTFGEKSANMYAVSMTERISIPDLIEGRLPVKSTECLIETVTAKDLGIGVGDVLTLTERETSFLKSKELTVTGIVMHPDHINNIVPDLLYVIVTKDAFDPEALDGAFMKAEIIIDREKEPDRMSDSYLAECDKVLDRIEEVSPELAAKRDGETVIKYRAELEENRKKLSDAKTQLEDARVEIDSKTEELKNAETEAKAGEEKLNEAKALLDDGWIQLEAGRIQLENAKSTIDTEKVKLDDAKALLDDAKIQLDDAKAQLEDGFVQLEDAKKKIRDVIKTGYETAFKEDADRRLIPWAEYREPDIDDPASTASYLELTENFRIDLSRPLEEVFSALIYAESVPDMLLLSIYTLTEGAEPPKVDENTYDIEYVRKALVDRVVSKAETYNKLSEGCRTWNDAHEQYLSGLEEYKTGLAQYEAGLSMFNDGVAQYEEGYGTYLSKLEEYNTGKAQYDSARAELDEGLEKIAEGKELLADAEEKYADGMKQYTDGLEQFEEAEKKLDDMDLCRWIAYGMKGNAGYIQLGVGSSNFSGLRSTFSVLFIIVSVLVIFATVGKMVDEQRKLVGTTKALGFFYREVFMKYLAFGVSATLIGAVLSVIISRFFLSPFLLNGFGTYYNFDMTKVTMTFLPTVLVFIVAAALAALSVWFACRRLLSEPAVRLIQDQTPASRKGNGRKRRALSLYSRLILLNMRTDLKRVAVTIVSVAGCCSLIVVGFTLRSSIKGAMNRQYEDIISYDMYVKYNGDTADEIEKLLKENGAEYTQIMQDNITYKVNGLQAAELFLGDLESIRRFHSLNDIRTGKPLYPTNEGVLIQRKIAESFGFEVGSEFEIAIGGTKTATVRVGGIFENYLGRTIVMSTGYYEALFGKSPTMNAFLVKIPAENMEKFESAVKNTIGFETIVMADRDRHIVEASTSMVDSLVLVFIFIAALMAGVVLMNLTNMYMLQKKRELTVMRVNGFSVREVINYMLRETFVTTVSGIVLGIAIGTLTSYIIILTLEQPFIQFYRGADFSAWGIGAALTVLFTAIVNAIALRNVKDLKLTDVT